MTDNHDESPSPQTQEGGGLAVQALLKIRDIAERNCSTDWTQVSQLVCDTLAANGAIEKAPHAVSDREVVVDKHEIKKAACAYAGERRFDPATGHEYKALNQNKKAAFQAGAECLAKMLNVKLGVKFTGKNLSPISNSLHDFSCCGGNDDRFEKNGHHKAHTMDCDEHPGVIPPAKGRER